MRLKPAVYIERRAFLFEQLDANPKASYASLQRALKEKFKHAMQQKILREIRADYNLAVAKVDKIVVLAPTETVTVYRSVPAGSDNYVREDPSDEAMRRTIASEPKQFTEEDLKPAPQDFEF